MGEIRTNRIVSFSWTYFFFLLFFHSIRSANSSYAVYFAEPIAVLPRCVCAERHLSKKLLLLNVPQNKHGCMVSLFWKHFSVNWIKKNSFAQSSPCLFSCMFSILLWLHKYAVLSFVFLSFVCSAKNLKGLSKENSSPFFLETDGKNPISRYIYNLLTDGIKGIVKKDALLAILNEIAVRIEQISPDGFRS